MLQHCPFGLPENEKGKKIILTFKRTHLPAFVKPTSFPLSLSLSLSHLVLSDVP